MEKTTQQDSSVTYFQGNFSGQLYVCQNKYTRFYRYAVRINYHDEKSFG